AFVQRANNIPLNHSNLDIELGYFLPHSFSVRGFGSWLHTHGGISIVEVLANPQLIPIHDRLLQQNFWHLGMGAGYSLTRSLDLSFNYVTFLTGSNAHYGRVVTVGTLWNFSTRRLNTSSKSKAIFPVPSPNTIEASRSLQPSSPHTSACPPTTRTSSLFLARRTDVPKNQVTGSLDKAIAPDKPNLAGGGCNFGGLYLLSPSLFDPLSFIPLE